jgi:hypothetical protein
MIITCNNTEFNTLLEGRYIIPNDDKYYIQIVNAFGESIKMELNQLVNILSKDNIVETDTEDITKWIDEWRDEWRNKKVGTMGVRATCIKNMKEFIQLYPQYTKQDIYDARDLYMKNVLHQYGNYTYLQHADYFIKKKVKGDEGTETRATLLVYCEEVKANKDKGIIKDYTVYDDI